MHSESIEVNLKYIIHCETTNDVNVQNRNWYRFPLWNNNIKCSESQLVYKEPFM